MHAVEDPPRPSPGPHRSRLRLLRVTRLVQSPPRGAGSAPAMEASRRASTPPPPSPVSVPRSSAGGSVPPETQSRPAVGRRRDRPTPTPPATTPGASPSFAPASSLEMAAAGSRATAATNEKSTPQSAPATGAWPAFVRGDAPPLKGAARPGRGNRLACRAFAFKADLHVTVRALTESSGAGRTWQVCTCIQGSIQMLGSSLFPGISKP